MKNLCILWLSLTHLSIAYSQFTPRDFSRFSGSPMRVSYLISTPDGYILDLSRETVLSSGSQRVARWLYRLNEAGEAIDSFNISSSTRYCFGMPFLSLDNKLCFAGICGTIEAFYTQRYTAFEFDDNLNVSRVFESPTIMVPGKGVTTFGQTTDGALGSLFDFSIYNDTIFGYGRYLMVDSPLIIRGNTQFYFKANLNGLTYEDFGMPENSMVYRCFFKENELYVLGSCFDPTEPDRPKAVGRYNHEGRWIQGWNFDNATSGEFPWGACGGAIGDRLYFSYLGRDITLPGCPELNVAIDVRDLNFNVVRRFKINECGYLFAGNMPFAKTADGSIYFQAVHESYRKFLIQKYTPDLQLIWSKEFASEDNFFVCPLQIVTTKDNGVLVSGLRELNGDRRLFLYKFSPDGDPVVSTHEVAYEPLRPEPSVLSPNPCRDFVRYTGTHLGPMIAQLHSADGRVARLLRLENGTLDVSTLPPGLYSVLLFDAADTNRILHRQTLVKAWD